MGASAPSAPRVATVTTVAGLWRYPLKSARAQPLASARVLDTGIEGDRQWMLADASGRFMTQRELPQLATLQAEPLADGLRLAIPGGAVLEIHASQLSPSRAARVWDDAVQALDAGEAAATALGGWLGRPCRLLCFDPALPRTCDARWTGTDVAHTQFADAFPLLLIGAASLEELNTRLDRALPMDRFRPNLVVEGLAPYAEDRIDELRAGPLVLRVVKPCARCVATTTDLQRGERDGDEPLRTLRAYRHDAALHGVCFGQNLIVTAGAGATLAVGQPLEVRWRRDGGASPA
jgi:uncharacterized protein YcbX